MENKSNDKKKIVSLSEFKSKKSLEDRLSHGRKPLYVSHLNGKIKGSPHFNDPQADDFGDRLQRIKMSLEKINKLMAELKKISKED